MDYGGASNETIQLIENFWPRITNEIQNLTAGDFKNPELPLARIKKIMKLDEDVRMISAEAPVIFAKAAELFIQEASVRAWIHTEENKRRTLQRNDVALAISKYDQFDFLIDIVPREEIKTSKKENTSPSTAQSTTAANNNSTNTMNTSNSMPTNIQFSAAANGMMIANGDQTSLMNALNGGGQIVASQTSNGQLQYFLALPTNGATNQNGIPMQFQAMQTMPNGMQGIQSIQGLQGAQVILNSSGQPFVMANQS